MVIFMFGFKYHKIMSPCTLKAFISKFEKQGSNTLSQLIALENEQGVPTPSPKLVRLGSPQFRSVLLPFSAAY